VADEAITVSDDVLTRLCLLLLIRSSRHASALSLPAPTLFARARAHACVPQPARIVSCRSLAVAANCPSRTNTPCCTTKASTDDTAHRVEASNSSRAVKREEFTRSPHPLHTITSSKQLVSRTMVPVHWWVMQCSAMRQRMWQGPPASIICCVASSTNCCKLLKHVSADRCLNPLSRASVQPAMTSPTRSPAPSASEFRWTLVILKG
jgi:hypothetical protein